MPKNTEEITVKKSNGNVAVENFELLEKYDRKSKRYD